MSSSAEIREHLLALLDAWAAGSISPEEVRDTAELLCSQVPDWPPLVEVDGVLMTDRGQESSVVATVATLLDSMHLGLVVPDDIPAIRRLLTSDTPPNNKTAWSEWDSYWDSVDVEQRQRCLKSDPFYAVGDS